MKVVYHRQFAMGFPGLGLFHPFDGYRCRRVDKEMKRRYGRRWSDLIIAPTGPAPRGQLQLVHSPHYLDQLQRSVVVARTLEMPAFALLPVAALNWIVVNPVRWAVSGTVLGAEAALQHGVVFSLGGGFHHAKPGGGEGFCIYNDIALAILELRRSGRLAEEALVLYIDLDAHQGNGVCHFFLDDPRVKIFDVYNQDVYPDDHQAQLRVDVDCPVPQGTGDDQYLAIVRERLPEFVAQHADRAGLVIYNAGSDVYHEDLLGGLSLTAPAVLARDQCVAEEVCSRRLPLLILPSGGYSRRSYLLICETLAALMAGASPVT